MPKKPLKGIDMTKNIDFEKQGGLVPAIVQDALSNEVLMLGYMDEKAYDKTIATGYVTFWSRSRAKQWMKGEESGNTLKVIEIKLDCDTDTLLLKVHVGGEGVCCHTGERSCFFKAL